MVLNERLPLLLLLLGTHAVDDSLEHRVVEACGSRPLEVVVPGDVRVVVQVLIDKQVVVVDLDKPDSAPQFGLLF